MSRHAPGMDDNNIKKKVLSAEDILSRSSFDIFSYLSKEKINKLNRERL